MVESTGTLKNVMPGETHADASVLVERLLPKVAELLNAIMNATPVDTLSGVDMSSTFAVMRRRGPRLAGLPGFLRLLLVGGMSGEIGLR